MDHTVRAITRPPGHHFFGYYDMRPWDATGRYHLVLEVGFMDRPPTPEDVAVVGAADLAEEGRFVPLSQTRAWNFQQGAMLNWLGGAEGTFVFNDRRDGRFVCVACEMAGRTERVLGPAVGAVSDDGRYGATLNFARIAHTRPGYGYEGLADPGADEPLPGADGVGVLDLAGGEHRLIARFPDLAPLQPAELEFGRTKVWFNHVYFNPAGDRLAWLCRWVPAAGRPWTTQMWTANRDGSDLLRCLDGPLISHFDWRDDRTIVAWAGVGETHCMWLVDSLGREDPQPFHPEVIRQDGHINYSHDRQWVVTDTYPDEAGKRRLFIVHCDSGRDVDLGGYYSPRPEKGEIRCDLHPSWSADDRQIAFDGMHEGTRQRYVVELKP